MANNYTQTSAFLDIPADKLEKAVELARKIEEIYSEYSEWESFDVEWDTADGGVWIHGDESIDLDAAGSRSDFGGRT